MTYWNLEAWQKARLLTKEIYQITRSFPKNEIYGLSAQMRRAGVSVVCNIAEGEARWSFKEQSNFYVVARGSLMNES
jgi:four helix bundle protein